MRDDERLAGLHVIVDDPEVADAVLRGGGRVVQVRLKTGTDRQRLAVVAAVVERCRSASAMCIVNDRLDLALAAGAAGVHLGADDLPVAVARSLAPSAFVIGATARDVDTARRLCTDGASYIGAGAVWETESKSGLPPPIGLSGLEAIAHGVDAPVVAIAGITLTLVPEVLATGAAGIAVLGAVRRASDATEATRALVDAIDRHKATITTGSSSSPRDPLAGRKA
ncbi:MAG: thiamine phosphate synthase [Acidimicrobiales bacterium]